MVAPIVDDLPTKFIGYLQRYPAQYSKLQALVECIKNFTAQHGKTIFPFQIMMPCGHTMVINSMDDFPLVDTPCTCGDPYHWFVKYEVTL